MALSYLVRNGGAEDGNELELSLENRPLGAVLLDLQSPSFSAVVRGSRAWPLMHIERDIRRTSSLLCKSSGGQAADSSLSPLSVPAPVVKRLKAGVERCAVGFLHRPLYPPAINKQIG